MERFSMSDILRLSLDERLQLVEDLWDSIAAIPESVPLTDAQREELDHRLENFHKNPESGSPWIDVKRRILGNTA